MSAGWLLLSNGCQLLNAPLAGGYARRIFFCETEQIVAVSGYAKFEMQLLLRICGIFVELTGNLQRSKNYFGICEPKSEVFLGG